MIKLPYNDLKKFILNHKHIIYDYVNLSDKLEIHFEKISNIEIKILFRSGGYVSSRVFFITDELYVITTFLTAQEEENLSIQLKRIWNIKNIINT